MFMCVCDCMFMCVCVCDCECDCMFMYVSDCMAVCEWMTVCARVRENNKCMPKNFIAMKTMLGIDLGFRVARELEIVNCCLKFESHDFNKAAANWLLQVL